jgi:predicted metal-binding protein
MFLFLNRLGFKNHSLFFFCWMRITFESIDCVACCSRVLGTELNGSGHWKSYVIRTLLNRHLATRLRFFVPHNKQNTSFLHQLSFKSIDCVACCSRVLGTELNGSGQCKSYVIRTFLNRYLATCFRFFVPHNKLQKHTKSDRFPTIYCFYDGQ